MSNSFTVRELLAAWKLRYGGLTTRQKVIGASVILVQWVSLSFTFFGLNFWLFSFRPQKWSNFISIWLPSLVWAVGYAVPIAVWKLVAVPKSESWGFVFSWKSMRMLIAIGVLDSLGGLTAVYSTKLTPIFLQTMLTATMPIWTFLLTKVFYPERARPFTVYPAVAFTLIFIGVVTSGIHQFQDITLGSATNLIWCFIYLLGIFIPPVYATIQGKYLYTFSDMNSSILSTRFIVLAGDCIIQLLATTLYFPLDAVPWFGTSPYRVSASWEGFNEALDCVRTCEYNAQYMMMYVGGFYVTHWIGAVMNHYSPTLLAVVGLVAGPINVLLLIVWPALQVSGAPGDWYLQVICLICTLAASILFIVWEESIRFLQTQQENEAAESDERARLIGDQHQQKETPDGVTIQVGCATKDSTHAQQAKAS